MTIAFFAAVKRAFWRCRCFCGGCGARYGDNHGFPDLVIADSWWRRIEPRNGLLCPNCICKRLHDLGAANVPFAFTSGPLYDDEQERRLRAVLRHERMGDGPHD